ncbi:MAG: (deoxy)nucleoside triphosphate pyrophosphohydrolase [Candidatus Wallbacteria bacterium]|nr:(deoxy)nucleoside triphosphate pyrophosphohydrolase [Candidatus Wallbacteria bacterium]
MKTVLAAIIEKDGKYLIARRAPGENMSGKWEFPGGKLETGESHQECLARELFEEFGIRSVIGDFFGESVYRYGYGDIRLLAYRVISFIGEFVPVVHNDLRWVLPQEMKDYDFTPADLPFVNLIRALNTD